MLPTMAARSSKVRLERTRVLKAMAHPSRLLILETLTDGERCVCDLQRVVGSDLSTVSKHLALMRDAGLVADRREGLQVFYRLRVPCVLGFLDCVDAVRAIGRKPDLRRVIGHHELIIRLQPAAFAGAEQRRVVANRVEHRLAV